ncbi:MAG TPA: universal stress protein [Gaiellaceae bacterium]|nr:universal stress protein [Gaiellaceae bacterium]
MRTSIVCGLDDSPDSRDALEVAARLADRIGARLIAANVVDYLHAPYAAVGSITAAATPRPLVTAPPEEHVEAAADMLSELIVDAGLDQDEVEQRVLLGFAAERLADLADEEDAELIVVGSRGRGAVKSALLGSVSTSLVGVARRPVLVVPRGTAEAFHT